MQYILKNIKTIIFNKKTIHPRNIFIGLITCVFLIEFITTIYLYVGNVETTRISGLYKLTFEVILISFISFKKELGVQFKLLFLLIIIYLTNQLFNPIFFENITYQFLKGSLYYLNRFIYPFVFIFSFLSLKDNNKIATVSLAIIEWLLIGNAILMLLGLVFNIELFSSYAHSERFGYDGLFNKINETSYLYTILIAHRYYKTIHRKEKVYKLIIAIAISFLLGAKAILFFLGLLLLFHLIFIARFKQIYRIAIIPILTVGIIFFTDIASFLFKLSPFWENLGKQYTPTTLLFSTRDIMLANNMAYISQNWSFINYLIGGPYYTANFFNIEMDLPDLVLFFGVIGAIIYLILLKKIYFKNNTSLINSLLFLIVLTGFFAGGLFLSVMAMIYLYLFKTTTMSNYPHFPLNK